MKKMRLHGGKTIWYIDRWSFPRENHSYHYVPVSRSHTVAFNDLDFVTTTLSLFHLPR